MTPHTIETGDLEWVHALNERHAVELSSLSGARLAALVARAFYAGAIAGEAAFMMAFDQDADYDSPNFLWFKQQLPRFVYVDRVVVSPAQRRRGLARLLYQDLFRTARGAGQATIVCEVNSDPPNPVSDAFHASLGFAVIGRASLAERAKSVRYLRCDLAS